MSRPIGGRSSPEASGATHTLSPEAHQGPLTVSTWLDEKETGSATTCRLGTAVFANAGELLEDAGIDVTCYLDFVTGEGRRFAGTLTVKCRYVVGLDDRCGGSDSPEAASTTGVQDLLDLAASDAAPLVFNAGELATADDASMAE